MQNFNEFAAVFSLFGGGAAFTIKGASCLFYYQHIPTFRQKQGGSPVFAKKNHNKSYRPNPIHNAEIIK